MWRRILVGLVELLAQILLSSSAGNILLSLQLISESQGRARNRTGTGEGSCRKSLFFSPNEPKQELELPEPFCFCSGSKAGTGDVPFLLKLYRHTPLSLQEPSQLALTVACHKPRAPDFDAVLAQTAERQQASST